MEDNSYSEEADNFVMSACACCLAPDELAFVGVELERHGVLMTELLDIAQPHRLPPDQCARRVLQLAFFTSKAGQA